MPLPIIIGGFVGGGLLLLNRQTIKLPSKFDQAFKVNCKSVPIELMRAIAQRESSFRSTLKSTVSSATGLMQVVNVVRESYNKRFGTHWTQDDLIDVNLNIKMACFQFANIMKSYQKNHSSTLGPDFSSRRWIELFAAGWNAGHSEAAGVGYVVGLLEEDGLAPYQIGLEQVHKKALALKAAGSTKGRFLAISARVKYCQDIARMYFGQRGII